MTDAVRLLTINTGSSSLKAALYQMDAAEQLLLAASAERIGLPGGRLHITGAVHLRGGSGRRARLVDRMGRRPLALIGMAGMIVSLASLGLAFRQPSLSGGAGWFAVVCLMLYVASFAISLGTIFWLIIAEIYPLKIRGLAMSVATMANWASNLVVALTFLTLAQALGLSATFWMFGLFTVAAWLFVYFLMPETKGRTLEEIQEFWRSGEPARGVDVPADARQPTIRPNEGRRASAA